MLSTDHRGVPSSPGRVVTLVSRDFWATLEDPHAQADDRVWGVAFKIRPERVDEVRDSLIVREQGGFTIHHTSFQPADGKPTNMEVFIGTPENEQFAGPMALDELARLIFESRGPSGTNREYLFGLETALATLGPDAEDEHVKDLAGRVRALEVAEIGGDSSREEAAVELRDRDSNV